MKIAVVNEISAAVRNPEIIRVLQCRGHEVINAGMKTVEDTPEMTYIHTGLLAGLLLGTHRVDLVIGGCGTGQGFLNSVMQYPGVVCGLIANDLDAWLFAQINGGNCVSLPLLFRYGWAGDMNLTFIFDKLFSFPEFGTGYPPHRKESQCLSRARLSRVSGATHKSLAEIVVALDEDVIRPVLAFPGVIELLQIDTIAADVREAIKGRM